MEAVFLKIGLALIVPAIIALVKLYGDYRSLDTKHKSLQNEVSEYKKEAKEDLRMVSSDHKADIADFKKEIADRFTKLESLIEKLFTYDREQEREMRRRKDD